MAHVLFVQTGDFGKACADFAAGASETYHDQIKSVNFVRDMAPAHQVTIASISSEPYDRNLGPGLRAIGVHARRFHSRAFGAELLTETRPGALVARLPHFGVLEAATARHIPSYPCLADIFDPVGMRDLLSRSGLRTWRNTLRMRRIFSDPSVTAVGNHSLSASLSLERVLGVDPSRITPWEWSRISVPETPKAFPEERLMEVLYVGALSEAKGVGDLLEAIRLVEMETPGRVHLSVAGEGPNADQFRARAAETGMPRISFLGKIPKSEVRARMINCDVIVVPSRPSYAEGLPNAVVEGLGHRAALVIAEHSSIRDRVTHEVDALICCPLDPTDMARQIQRLGNDRTLFESLTRNAAAAYDKLFIGASWYEVVGAFTEDPTDRSGWVSRHSLQTLRATGRVKS